MRWFHLQQIYLSDGDVPFLKVSFVPIFYRAGLSKEGDFMKSVVRVCQKEKLCSIRLLLSQVSAFLSILFRPVGTRFILGGG